MTGIIPKIVTVPKQPQKPLDLTKERMAVEAYNKISIGVSIAVISVVLSLMFATGIVHTIAGFGITVGGVWALLGFIKLFIATYLIIFCWVAFIAAIVGLLIWARKKSIVKLWKDRKHGKNINA